MHELSIERVIKASPDKVWDAMTNRFAEWWCPKPWRTDVEKIEWKAGGASNMTLRGPEGEEHKLEGVILEFVPGSHWVSTDALTEGWVPHEAFMVGRWSVEAHPDGTLYRASARHWSAEAMEQHRAMGFEDGWKACAEQLATLVEGEVMADEQSMPPMPGVIPHLTILDGRGKEAVEFFKQALPVEGEPGLMPAEDGKRLMHAHLQVNGGSLMLADDFPEYREKHSGQGNSTPGGVTMHLDVADVDAAHKRAADAGAKEIMPPADMFWGQRYSQVMDPFGHRWAFGGPLKGDAQ